MSTIQIPQILLPSDSIDMRRWAVNACDQYTSDYAYWQTVKEQTGSSAGTLNLILPEIYLNDNPKERIEKINKTMYEYLSGDTFKKVEGGFILVERTTQSGVRTGLVIAIDLEDYSFIPDSKALIRSTEATILERIPPRVEIRKNAPLELPHVMLLYDDEENSVLNSVRRGKVLYDFDLMCGGGHIKGTFVENAQEVISKFYSLCTSQQSLKKYGVDEKILFAVGDGNHSLATAKTCWDNIKKGLSAEQIKTHPARFALVEAVNIYDSALMFEPIHRFIKTKNSQQFLKNYKTSGNEKAYIVTEGKKTEIPFNTDVPEGIRSLDKYITEFITRYGGEVDYTHGEEDLINLTQNGVGILLPAIKKDDFFRLIISGGNLPRKTFSMGEGYEKRYYLEAKLIK